VVLVTAPDEAAAAVLARTLVDERLIACANLVPKAPHLPVEGAIDWRRHTHRARQSPPHVHGA